MSIKQRISWVDTAKGVGILFVVLFHMPIKELPKSELWGGVYCVILHDIFLYVECFVL